MPLSHGTSVIVDDSHEACGLMCMAIHGGDDRDRGGNNQHRNVLAYPPCNWPAGGTQGVLPMN